MHKVFIDGEAGTTGLEMAALMEATGQVELLRAPPAQRKDPATRSALMSQAELVVLCLPPDAAVEAVALVDRLRAEGKPAPRLLDASSAHRTTPGWVFGFPELAPGQAAAIHHAERVSNPGCYSTGAIALLRPLVDAGLIAPDARLAINSVSGYTGGGRAMIDEHDAGKAPPFYAYGMGQRHKHLPEIVAYSRLSCWPVFLPSVGDYARGMLVQIPIALDTLDGVVQGRDLERALALHYQDSEFVKVLPPTEDGRIDPMRCNGSNTIELRVYRNEPLRQAVLVAVFDNLGKGASGAAMQNLRLMLDLPAPAAAPLRAAAAAVPA